jgi:4-carboxymuconolactone decarboxylase
MADDERRARGEEWFRKIYGDGVPIPADQMRDPFLDTMFKQLFGEIWPREGLSLRDRRLMAIGVLAALGEAETCGTQFQAALRNGELTESQVTEVLIFLAPYVGYPRLSRLRPIVLRVLAELAKEAGPAKD